MSLERVYCLCLMFMCVSLALTRSSPIIHTMTPTIGMLDEMTRKTTMSISIAFVYVLLFLFFIHVLPSSRAQSSE
jgi:hypothetical protein